MAEFSSLNGYAVKDSVARSIAKGRNQAVAFTDYATMIEALNEYEKDEYKAGQNVYIGVVGVPDLWVYSVEDIRHTFTYTSDEEFVEMLKTNTTVQVGFFKLAMLEGQKVDLTTYDQKILELDNSIGKDDNDMTVHEKLDRLMEYGFSRVVYLGVGRSFNISSFVGVENIGKYSSADFVVGWDCPTARADYYNGPNYASIKKISDFTLTYDKETGNVTLSDGVFQIWARNDNNNIDGGVKNVNGNAMVWLILKPTL